MTETTAAATDFSAWLNKSETETDVIAPRPARALAATLDLDGLSFDDGAPLPPLWHWLYHLPLARASEIGRDGHPKRGDFLPPIDLPRRMFAGARLKFHAPVPIGAPVARERVVQAIERKEGKAGPLYVMTLRHRLRLAEGAQDVLIEEDQDIVYLGGAPAVGGGQTAEDLPAGATTRTVVPDPVLLFRFSALTFNAHRIHYDLPYARVEEGYPDLVVHGPLTAVLLADLGRRHFDRPLSAFSFRAKAPIFLGDQITLAGWSEGESYRLSARRASDGAEAMSASASA